MFDAINHHETLRLPNYTSRKWVLDCRNVGYGEHALQYLSSCTADKDIINITDDNLTFRYRDDQTNEWKTRTRPPLRCLSCNMYYPKDCNEYVIKKEDSNNE